MPITANINKKTPQTRITLTMAGMELNNAFTTSFSP